MAVRDVQFDIRADDKTRAAFATVQQNLKRSAADAKQLNAVVATSGKVIGTLAAGLGAGVAIGGLAQLPGVIRDVVAEAAGIGDVADKIGITTDALQALQYQAQQSGSSAETMNSALEQFSKRIGEAALGGGELAKILAANGIALTDQAGNLRPITELLADYAELIKNAKSESDQFVLTTEAFGRGAGSDMVLVLREGADGIRRFGLEAQATGQIFREDLIRRGQEIDDTFDALAGTLGTFAQEQVIIFVSDLADAMGDMAGWMARIRDLAQTSPLESMESDGAVVKDIAEQLAQAEATLRNLQGVADQGIFGNQIEIASQEVARLRGELVALQQASIGVNAALHRRAEDGSMQALGEYTPDADPAKSTVLPSKPNPGGGGAGGRGTRISEAERAKKALDDVLASLRFEHEQLGRNALQQEIYNQAKRAGVEVGSEAGQIIAAQVTSNEVLRASQERMREAQERLNDSLEQMGETAGDALGRIIVDGADAKDVLRQIIDEFAKAQITKGFTGLFGSLGGEGGGIGGLIGRLIGPGRAGGGGVFPGRLYPVGERGPELFAPGMAGRVIPNGGGGGSLQVVINNNAPTRVQAQETSDGANGRRLELQIDEAVAGAAARPGGKTGRAFANRFGAAQRLVRR